MSSWDNPKTKITPNFTVGEALYLRKWDVYHRPTDAEKNAIRKTAMMAERIRLFLGGLPITPTSWLRPQVANIPGHPMDGRDYNAFVRGAKKSAHKYGLAIDYVVKGLDADEVRRRLLPMLEVWGVRMEDLPGSNWVHNDLMEPRPSWYFKP